MTSATGRRFMSGLLDQQLWCFGQDIRRNEGNLLCQLGMCRIRPPRTGAQSTLYQARIRGAASLSLWGFGVLLADTSGNALWIKRYTFNPLLLEAQPSVPVHTARELGTMRRPVSRTDMAVAGALVRDLAEWMATYEHWVAENLGARYRQESLLGKPTAPVVRATEMAKAWERVACRKWRPALADPGGTGPWGSVLSQLRSTAGFGNTAGVGQASGARGFLRMTRGGGGLWVA